ncbi:MAG: HPr family phosphocarrier protein [Flavobacteriaceae bacterium]
MVEKIIALQDQVGFHARTAALFAKRAAQFKAEIQVGFKEKIANGKSTLALMTLGVKSMEEIKIIIQGPDEQAAMEALTTLIESQFKV